MNARGAGGRIEFEERSVIASRRGLPWWTVTPLAVAIALTGVALDSVLTGAPGIGFTVCFFLGCVGAVLVAARKAIYTAGVQAPIIMTVMVPLVAVITGTAGGSGFLSRTQIVGALLPLVSRFPLMAITTVVTIALALIRAYVLEPRPRADPRGTRVSRGVRRPARPKVNRRPAPDPRGSDRSAPSARHRI